jgi:hypothetical protein
VKDSVSAWGTVFTYTGCASLCEDTAVTLCVLSTIVNLTLSGQCIYIYFNIDVFLATYFGLFLTEFYFDD